MNPLTWVFLHFSQVPHGRASVRPFYSQPELIGSDFRENSPEHRGFLQAQAELFAGYGFRFFLTIFDCHQLSPIGKNNEPE
jgi:hypothetical protein